MMFGRPIYLFSTVFVVAFGYLFFLTLINEGLPERLPVAVVDSDNSAISRRLARELNTTPDDSGCCRMYKLCRGQRPYAKRRDIWFH